MRRVSGLMIFVFVFVFVFRLIILLTWSILRPKKPRFTLQDATIFNLNVISSTVQVTVSSRNPNSKIGIYYDKMVVYATYHNQQITNYAVISPVYQGHKDVNVWSPLICPCGAVQWHCPSQDKTDGAINLIVRLNGRVRWKVGSFISGHYQLHVTCPAYIPIGNTGIVIGNAVKYQLSQSCSVNV